MIFFGFFAKKKVFFVVVDILGIKKFFVNKILLIFDHF